VSAPATPLGPVTLAVSDSAGDVRFRVRYSPKKKNNRERAVINRDDADGLRSSTGMLLATSGQASA